MNRAPYFQKSSDQKRFTKSLNPLVAEVKQMERSLKKLFYAVEVLNYIQFHEENGVLNFLKAFERKQNKLDNIKIQFRKLMEKIKIIKENANNQNTEQIKTDLKKYEAQLINLKKEQPETNQFIKTLDLYRQEIIGKEIK